MRRRIAVLGVTDDAIEALPRLASRSDLELACVYDAEALALRRRLALYEPRAAALLQKLLTDDPSALAGLEAIPAREVAALAGVSRTDARDAPAELLDALGEIADAAALVDDPAAACERLLGAAIEATGAGGGSLLVVDAGAEVLRVAAATDVERELWPKIALPLGAGLAGRAWAEGRPLRIVGQADPDAFDLVRERHDVASAALVPLVAGGAAHGVLCLHHATRREPLAEPEALEALGAALGRVLAIVATRRREREGTRRAAIEAAVHALFEGPGAHEPRLAALCALAAESSGGGVATLWSRGEGDAADAPLRLVASSLPGGALGAAATLAPGDGVDGRAASERAPILLHRAGGALAYAALPLLDGAHLLGVLSIQTGDASPEDATCLRALADAAARALAREAALADAQRRAARCAAIAEAALQLGGEREPGRIAAALATRAALAADAEEAIVRLLDPAQRRFRIRARAGLAAPADDPLAALDRRAAREAVRRRASLDAPAGDDPAWLATPICDGPRVLGTLGLYAKRGPAARFDALDRASAEQLAALAAHALAAAAPSPAPDDDAALLSAVAFARRLDAEVARARAGGGGSAAFALLHCRIENAASLGEGAVERVARAIGAELRAFDVAARTAPDAVCALLPEPGGVPAERIARLARAVSERVANASPAPRPALVFGWALHPDDADTPAALRTAAATPRLRML